MEREKEGRFYLLVLAYNFAFLAWYVPSLLSTVGGLEGFPVAVLLLKGLLEILVSFFLISTLLKAIFFLLEPTRPPGDEGETPEGSPPPLAVIYLCCGDLDRRALGSLFRLDYPGSLQVIVHEDSRDQAVRRETKTLAEALGRKAGRPVLFLSRPERIGGKPGAVAYILDRVGSRFDFFLLCDNDSTVLEADCLLRALPRFRDPEVAVLQFRNVGIPSPGESPVAGRLIPAIDSFQVFLHHQSRYGWMPFVGHNALLRTSAVREAGGLRAGYLSDDIDLSLRLYLIGYRVEYEPGIAFGECHPPSYRSFRARSRKWSFGCMQILRQHLFAIFRSPRLRWTQKLGFLEFAGFYTVQAGLLSYLILTYLVLPFAIPEDWSVRMVVFLPGFLVLGAIFSPTLAYFLKERKLREWPEFAWLCTLVYGSSAFSTTRGLIEYLHKGSKEWIPTNGRACATARGTSGFVLESIFGMLLFAVPLIQHPVLLFSPASYLFIAIFLFPPLLDRSYRQVSPGRDSRPASRRRAGLNPVMGRGVGLLFPFLLASAISTTGCGRTDGAEGFSIKGDLLLRDGKGFQVRGIHYSPWRAGTGPAKDYPWPADDLVREDLQLLKGLDVNTVEFQDAPPRFVRMAAEEGFAVLYVFYLDWQRIGEGDYLRSRKADMQSTLETLSGNRSILAWVIGHEVTQWVRDDVGNEFIQERLQELYRFVKQRNPHQLVTHANWPVTKDLDLGFLDFTSFNLYPAWPREVVVRGYGNYIEEVLLPIAGDRPLVITEFGVNTLESDEATQAEVLARCWKEIRERTSGGVVFEFADEWWKNYDNPIREGEWWEREHAPDDEKVHDLDPEEFYGIVRTNRDPKPAFRTVQRMFAPAKVPREAYLAGVLAVLTIYTVYVVRRSGR